VSLELTIDANGQKHIEFADLRLELIVRGETFEHNLSLVHYSQLSLCSIANAGAVRCEPSLVAQEQARRRSRFTYMDLAKLDSCRRYLEAQGMYGDVLEEMHFSRSRRRHESTVNSDKRG
jgi:hypothetical protein